MRKYQRNDTSPAGFGLGSILTIIFVVLKLCDLIDWSWLCVLSPMWISFIIHISIILLVVICIVLDEKKREKKYGNKNNFDKK